MLALYLVRIRLDNVPTADSVRRQWTVPTGLLLIAVAEALLLPVREANADWRLLGWILTGLAAAATLIAFAQAGGRSWMAHFTFPVLFFFTAVPWPRPIETDVMQWLMRHNAQLTAELLHWLGVEAVVQGNLIKLSASTMGIDEACSGVRSLQGALMATLFIGEIFELSRRRRVVLLLAGAVWALVTNLGRMLFLSLAAEWSGIEAHDRWHDPAGYWALGVCLAGVAVTGWLLGRPHRGGGTSRLSLVRGATGRLAVPSGAALAGVVLVLVSWGGTKAWFRMHEDRTVHMADWSFSQPAQAAHFESVEQSSLVRGMLRYDFYAGGRWLDAEGRRWVAHYFRWNPGLNVTQTVLVHDPRICLAASGKDLVQTLPSFTHVTGGVALPFDAYWFRDGGQNVFVFNSVVEDARRGSMQKQDPGLFTMSSRLEAVRTGKRNLGHRRLEVAVWGAWDAASAREAFEALLRHRLVVQNDSTGPR